MSSSVLHEPLGDYSPYDGTIEFFGRVAAVLSSDHVVVDLGAGRGAWFFEDISLVRRSVRDLRPLVSRVVGLDIDPVVLRNPTTSLNFVIENGRFPLETSSIDAIVADYVLEHVVDVDFFVAEVDRVLRPGGYFMARTPHKWQYVSVAARLFDNGKHASILRVVQPGRKAEDVFPTAYKVNTMRDLAFHFSGYENFSYLYRADPSYDAGSRSIRAILSVLHRFLPDVLVSNLFVFLRKPD